MSETWKQWEGQVINGEFRLQAYVGGSDHSAVFLTEKRGAREQKAAIKLIAADPEGSVRQLALWERITGLSHSHLIHLFRAGRCELGGVALLYVVMEYAEESLSQILPERPLTPAESRDMLTPVVDALVYLHGQGFVHGHLRPANVLAVADAVKISSDGLCAVAERGRERKKLAIYDPPEAANGTISTAGDAWSLGITLVEVMTQKLPVWDRGGSGEPLLPEGLPAPFLEIAHNCLRRDPKQRWTIAQIAARLQPAPPLPARVATVTPRKTSATWRYLAPAIAGVLLLLMVAGLRKGSRSPQAEPSPSEAAEPGARPKPTPATVQSAPVAKRESPATPTPTAARSEPAARVSRGNIVPGAVVHQVVPEASQSARDTVTGKVRVRVKVTVDAAGNVTGATFDTPGPSKYFARLAMQAAPGWKFTPPQVNGRNVPSQWILRFAFGRAGTEVYQVQTAP